MDWDLAIKRNSEALAGIVETLFVMLGLVGEATVSRLPWPTYRAVLRILRPAESALRRLIVVAARGLVIAPAVSRPRRAGGSKKKASTSRPSFQLFDPRTRIVLPRRRIPPRPGPRIHIFNADNQLVTIWPPPRPAASPAPTRTKSADGMVSAARVIRRLEALESALADLRARPCAWCAGACGRRSRPTPVSKHRSGAAVRRATAGGKFTKSTSCSASATGWPATPR